MFAKSPETWAFLAFISTDVIIFRKFRWEIKPIGISYNFELTSLKLDLMSEQWKQISTRETLKNLGENSISLA